MEVLKTTVVLTLMAVATLATRYGLEYAERVDVTIRDVVGVGLLLLSLAAFVVSIKLTRGQD